MISFQTQSLLFIKVLTLASKEAFIPHGGGGGGTLEATTKTRCECFGFLDFRYEIIATFTRDRPSI